MRKGSAQRGGLHHGTEQLGDSLALRDKGIIAIASALPVEPHVESAAILEALDKLPANKDMTTCMHAGLTDLHESLHDCTLYIWSSLPGLQGCQFCLRCLPIQHAHQGTPKPEVVDDLYNCTILSEPGKYSQYVWRNVLLGYLMTKVHNWLHSGQREALWSAGVHPVEGHFDNTAFLSPQLSCC